MNNFPVQTIIQLCKGESISTLYQQNNSAAHIPRDKKVTLVGPNIGLDREWINGDPNLPFLAEYLEGKLIVQDKEWLGENKALRLDQVVRYAKIINPKTNISTRIGDITTDTNKYDDECIIDHRTWWWAFGRADKAVEVYDRWLKPKGKMFIFGTAQDDTTIINAAQILAKKEYELTILRDIADIYEGTYQYKPRRDITCVQLLVATKGKRL